jgi:excisionase family DNA binding protein
MTILTTEQLAEFLQVNTKTVLNWVKKGVITPFVRSSTGKGATIRFDKEAVIEELKKTGAENAT